MAEGRTMDAAWRKAISDGLKRANAGVVSVRNKTGSKIEGIGAKKIAEANLRKDYKSGLKGTFSNPGKYTGKGAAYGAGIGTIGFMNIFGGVAGAAAGAGIGTTVGMREGYKKGLTGNRTSIEKKAIKQGNFLVKTGQKIKAK